MEMNWVAPGENTAAAFAVRTAVFVEEQGFSEKSEFDEIDPTAWHLVLLDGSGNPAACGRIFADEQRQGTWILGRIAVMRPLRGTGAGRLLMEEMERKAKALGATRLELGAQEQAKGFYERQGYSAYGEQYMDEHVPHIHMEKAL